MKNKRIADYGINIGKLRKGALNKITDVPGVTVGHSTIRDDTHNTGVTVIMPCEANIFYRKLVGASFVHNGFGKTTGTVQVDELGTLETPIALTNTLNVGLVSDALIQYTIDRCKREGGRAQSINTVVGECNDSMINTITERAVGYEHVMEAINTASRDFDEGNVGAGTGTQCYGMKGGIGSASRIITLDGKDYTIGILVQSNYGATADLRIDGKAVGEDVLDWMKRMDNSESEDIGAASDKGSIIVVLATDVPLTSRQLRRVIRRCSVGIARCGSYIGHGSGEVFLGFSTGNVISGNDDIMNLRCVKENKLEELFRAAGEATEEGILKSMVCSDEVRAFNGKVLRSLADYLDFAKGDDK